jgi:hypothetical protein
VRDNIPKGSSPGRPKKRWSDSFKKQATSLTKRKKERKKKFHLLYIDFIKKVPSHERSVKVKGNVVFVLNYS